MTDQTAQQQGIRNEKQSFLRRMGSFFSFRRAKDAAEEEEEDYEDDEEEDEDEDDVQKSKQGFWRRLAFWRKSLEKEIETGHVAEVEAPAVDSGPTLKERLKDPWSPERKEILNVMFGEGFMNPGGPDAIKTLVSPMGLNSTMSVMELGAGLGAVSRTIAEQTDAWVTAYEEDPVAAARAMEISTKLGMHRKAAIHHKLLHEVDARDHSVNAIVSKEAFYRNPHKKQIIENCYRMLKPRGHLLFTDYVISAKGKTDPSVKQWLRMEPEAQFWTMREYRQVLHDSGLEVRVAEDYTGRFARWMLRSFEGFAEHYVGIEKNPEMEPFVMNETKRWLLRVMAMDNKAVRLYRIYAISTHRDIM